MLVTPTVGVREVQVMAQCEVCGNDYEMAFEVHAQGAVHVFDSFECAIHLMAPTCTHCGCKVIGHGVQAGGGIYCCAHCMREASGSSQLGDRGPTREPGAESPAP
jgi:hypothetical protein